MAKLSTTPSSVGSDTTNNSEAISADAFIDSVGVNVHTYYNDTSYADTSRVTSLLLGLGVRHVRDVLVSNRPDEVSALTALGQAGIGLDLVLPGTGSGSSLAVDPDQISELRTLAPYVEAVEPPNEYDCSGDPNWVADLHAYVAQLVSTLQNDPVLDKLGVLSPSFCSPSSVSLYGSVTGSASVANSHDYAAGQPPELALEGRLPEFAAAQGEGLPSIVTETGYSDATAAGSFTTTQATAADYTLRAVLDAARLGVLRTYLYELLDEKSDPSLTDAEEHYGLVNVDGSAKPSYTAVQNLLADVAQGSPSAVTASSAAAAPYATTVTGGGSLLRSVTITDPNGTGQTLAVWLATPLENTTTHTALTNRSVPVQLAVSARVTATSRMPSGTNTVKNIGTNTSFSIPVSGQVTLVHLGAPTDATSASCTTQASYLSAAKTLGASASSTLAPASWTGSPSTTTTTPAGLSTATTVSSDGQEAHVTVSPSLSKWTITMWERTDAGSASYASFLHVTGASGALMRTYDLTDDLPSHYQLSAYGAPIAGAGYGTETYGQAVPGTWHLLALSSNGSQASFSVDGISIGSVASGSQAMTGIDVGALTSGYRGSVGGLEVFPSALSSAQLLTLATSAVASC